MALMMEPDGGGLEYEARTLAKADDLFAAGGALSAGSIAKTSAETKKLLDAAKAGGFKISAEGVKPLTDAIDAMQEQLEKVNRKMTHVLAEAPKLGSHDYGHTVAAHDSKGANDPSGSATAALTSLEGVLRDAKEALQRAAGIYRENEAQITGSLPPVT